MEIRTNAGGVIDVPDRAVCSGDVVYPLVSPIGLRISYDGTRFKPGPNNQVDRIIKVAGGILETLLRKNADYGSSANTRPALAPGVSATDAIRVRMGDKISRMINLAARAKDGNTPLVADESYYDTVRDLAGYCVLLMIQMDIDLEKTADGR